MRWSSPFALGLAVLAPLGSLALPSSLQNAGNGLEDVLMQLRDQAAVNRTAPSSSSSAPKSTSTGKSSSSSPASSNGSYPVSYDQSYRPQNHFSPSAGFMNDPNGLVVSGKPGNQTIHMYYQYNPTDLVAGNQHWGHATTKSFESYKWENHLPAIAPANSSEAIFSGSAVIDRNNTSGFFDNSTEPEDRIVAIYTHHTSTEQSQYVAYSTDGGYNFTKYEQNPVLRNVGRYQTQFRDPKVFWDEAHSQWVMAVAHTQEYQIGFYVSKDLKEWSEASRFGPAGLLGFQYECPALFQAPYKGGPRDGEKGWVLLISINPGAPFGGSATQYMVGDWDGKTFTAHDSAARLADFGKDWYAAQTWDNTDPSDAPVIIGWASNWQYTNVVPTNPWRSVMSVPREVTLQYADYNPLHSGYKMAQLPFNTSRVVSRDLLTSSSSSQKNTTVKLEGEGSFEIDLSVTMTADAYKNATTTSGVELLIHAGDDDASSSSKHTKKNVLRIGVFGGEGGLVYVDRRFAGGEWADSNPLFTDRFSVYVEPLYEDASQRETSLRRYTAKLLVDRSVSELFVNGGLESATVLHYWADDARPTRLEVKVGDDRVKVESLSVKALRSGW
ncbi:unnamed protein product [Parajaminaea phylloscopi]